MCVVCVYFFCIYIPMYPYSLMRRSLIFWWLFHGWIMLRHTLHLKQLVAEALARALSNVFSRVYYCHWKTTLVFFSLRTFIGSLFLPKHVFWFFFSENLQEFNFQLLSLCQNLLKIGQQLQKLQHKAWIGPNSIFVSGMLYTSLGNLYLLFLSCVFHIQLWFFTQTKYS